MIAVGVLLLIVSAIIRADRRRRDRQVDALRAAIEAERAEMRRVLLSKHGLMTEAEVRQALEVPVASVRVESEVEMLERMLRRS